MKRKRELRIGTCVFPLTDSVRTESGPVLNSCCSLASSSSGVISDLGFVRADDDAMAVGVRFEGEDEERKRWDRTSNVNSENVFGFREVGRRKLERRVERMKGPDLCQVYIN